MPAQMPAGEVVAILNAFDGRGIGLWIDGGWGVDGVLGRQTRPHADLDIVLEARHAVTAERLLRARGYGDVPRDDTRWWNFVLSDRLGHEVDFDLVTFDESGNGTYGLARRGGFYPACAFEAEGRIAAHPVRCLTLDYQMINHTGYSLRERDRHDIAELCRAFGRPLPPGYEAV